MVQWVEEGIAPDTLTAANYVGNNVSNGVGFTRPLCRVRFFSICGWARVWVQVLMCLGLIVPDDDSVQGRGPGQRG